MQIYTGKTGRGAFFVGADNASIIVDIDGYGEATFPNAQLAADHCRHVMFVCGDAPMADGKMPYFGAANALEAILETGEAE
jgi:hypothetical protein